jgi:hypothetical protein
MSVVGSGLMHINFCCTACAELGGHPQKDYSDSRAGIEIPESGHLQDEERIYDYLERNPAAASAFAFLISDYYSRQISLVLYGLSAPHTAGVFDKLTPGCSFSFAGLNKCSRMSFVCKS